MFARPSKLACTMSCALTLWVIQPVMGQTPIEALGKLLFEDENLSTPAGQGCVTCHDAAVGFTSPDSDVNEFFGPHPGVLPHRFGPRKPPSAAYAGDAGPLRKIVPEPRFGSHWEGGTFWDGRATGEILGDLLADQALAPFVNPVEQNNRNKKAVVKKVYRSSYRKLFESVWGKGSLNFKKRKVVQEAYDSIALSIAAFERSAEVNPFDSKFDHWLRGNAELTDQERLGLWVFENPDEDQALLIEPPPGADASTHGKANCFICHPSSFGPNGEHPLFTDFSYHNIGTPKNPGNPFYSMPKKFNPDGNAFIDLGLGGALKATGKYGPEVYEREYGRHKTPTLRNVDLRPYPEFVKAYGHNGFFKSMEEIVRFYNTRDIPEENWPNPEVAENLTGFIMGDLGLSNEEEAAIVAFMATLSDGYSPSQDEEVQEEEVQEEEVQEEEVQEEEVQDEIQEEEESEPRRRRRPSPRRRKK